MSVTSDAAATAITNAIESMSAADVQVLLKVMKAWMAQEEPYWATGVGVYLPVAVTRTYAPPVGNIPADRTILTESATRHWLARFGGAHVSFAVIAGNKLELQFQNTTQEFWNGTENGPRIFLVDHVTMQNSSTWILTGKILQTNANNTVFTRPTLGFFGKMSRSGASVNDWVGVSVGWANVAGQYWLYGARCWDGLSDLWGGAGTYDVVDSTYCTTGTEFELTGGRDGYFSFRYRKIGAGAWIVPGTSVLLPEGFVPFGVYASLAHGANATTTTTIQIYDLQLVVS